MRVELDKNGYIVGVFWDSNPDLPELPQEEYEKITKEQSAYKLENGKIVLDKKKLHELTIAFALEEIRSRRERECFAVMDRNPRFFARFTEKQNAILDTWYKNWLDAPETMVIPEPPEFI